ncbi:MAG: hypothetical protein HY725_07225 [Candidatus Rokubacteria bacterium]|nr:hypothetical protein [Candidatus Rokubacteria bacterium]
MTEASIIVAICALVVSVASLAASIYFSWCARDHNRRSVRPLPFVLQSDFEDRIAVVIRNNGTGPLILKKAEARNSTNSRSGHLIDLIPDPPPELVFTNFNRVHQIRAIRPGDQVDLLDLAVGESDRRAAAYRDELRRALGNMTVELTYTDIYDTCFPVYAIKLAWFHRHCDASA